MLGNSTAVTLNDAAPEANGPVIFNYTLNTPGTTGTFSGDAILSSSQITDLNAGDLYVNIRSTVFPSGEIRGQITAAPEPTTMALIGTGSLAWLALHRRKV